METKFQYFAQFAKGNRWSTFDNLTSLIMQSLVHYGGISEIDVANKLVCFMVDGLLFFLGVKYGVTTQLMQKHDPYVLVVCTTWHTIQTLLFNP